MPEYYGKAIYFLTTLAIMPERAFVYENALFDMMGFIDMESDQCDRVCHFTIDLLPYFSILEPTDELITKTLEAIVSLLSTASTR
jgi:hypothetical protein